MSDARFNACVSLLAGVLVAVAAHSGGKPWWVDSPMLGDATDVGVITAIGVRSMLALFERRK
jgi:hypothetical protein